MTLPPPYEIDCHAVASELREAMTKTEAVSDERLAEMLAGLEGVTPGPWWSDADGGDEFRAYAVFGPHERYGRPSSICDTHNAGEIVLEQEDGKPWDEQGRKNLAHIARCDPGTILSLITELLSRRAANSAGVEVGAADDERLAALIHTQRANARILRERGSAMHGHHPSWADHMDTVADALELLSRRAGGVAVRAKPRLTDAAIRAACKAHFGTDNADGVSMTANDRDWNFREAFKRMWRGAWSVLEPSPAVEAEPVAWQVVHDGGATFWNVESNAQSNAKATGGTVIPLYTHPSSPVSAEVTVDELAQIIRRVDGNHSLGAGELAECILAALNGGRENG